MKKILSVVALVLALNFLGVLGGVGYLISQHKLDREKLTAIHDVIFSAPTTAPTTEPADDAEAPTTQPLARLEQLVAGATGRPAVEQVELMQNSFDSQMALLDRRQRELTDVQTQVELSKTQLDKDRKELDARQKQFIDQQQAANKLATDQGFQQSLELYRAMPAKQVKTIFMGLDDATVTNYVTALEPREASKIFKEFKSPEELERIQKIIERVRLAQASTKEQ